MRLKGESPLAQTAYAGAAWLEHGAEHRREATSHILVVADLAPEVGAGADHRATGSLQRLVGPRRLKVKSHAAFGESRLCPKPRPPSLSRPLHLESTSLFRNQARRSDAPHPKHHSDMARCKTSRKSCLRSGNGQRSVAAAPEPQEQALPAGRATSQAPEQGLALRW